MYKTDIAKTIAGVAMDRGAEAMKKADVDGTTVIDGPDVFV